MAEFQWSLPRGMEVSRVFLSTWLLLLRYSKAEVTLKESLPCCTTRRYLQVGGAGTLPSTSPPILILAGKLAERVLWDGSCPTSLLCLHRNRGLISTN